MENDHFIDAYLAYSPAGDASGQVVYVNYGTKADFELLANNDTEYYTDTKGKICIARYGQVNGSVKKSIYIMMIIKKYFSYRFLEETKPKMLKITVALVSSYFLIRPM